MQQSGTLNGRVIPCGLRERRKSRRGMPLPQEVISACECSIDYDKRIVSSWAIGWLRNIDKANAEEKIKKQNNNIC